MENRLAILVMGNRLAIWVTVTPPTSSRLSPRFLVLSRWPSLFLGAAAALQLSISSRFLLLITQVPNLLPVLLLSIWFKCRIQFHISSSLATSKPPNNKVTVAASFLLSIVDGTRLLKAIETPPSFDTPSQAKKIKYDD